MTSSTNVYLGSGLGSKHERVRVSRVGPAHSPVLPAPTNIELGREEEPFRKLRE